MALNDFIIQIEERSKDNLLLTSKIVRENSRNLPAVKTLDILDSALRNINVRKIVIRKLSDYIEGDIF